MRIRLIEIALLLLLTTQMILTFQLWGTGHAYPRIPFFSGLVTAPSWVEWPGIVCVILSALCVTGSWFSKKHQKKLNRFGWIFLGISLIWVILFDQHRFQTWAWQIIVFSFCLTSMNSQQALNWMRGLVISVYFFSAVSKLEASFVNSYGQTILDGLLQAVSLSPIWSEETRWGIVLCFPLFELLIAILLLIPLTRRYCWPLSLFLHFGLLLVLGPWGLNHQTPVLIWNIYFIIQNTILFWPDPKNKETENPEEQTKTEKRSWPGYVMAILLVFPATEWFNLCDTWPGWGLYSARGARVTLSIDATVSEKIPQSLQYLLAPRTFGQPWRKFDLHRWAFEETNAPDYPQDRSQIAVARALINRFELHDGFQIVHQSKSDRFTGERSKTEMTTEQELDEFSKRFFINTAQRSRN